MEQKRDTGASAPPLLSMRIRADWKSVERQATDLRARLLRAAQLAVALYALAALFLQSFSFLQPWLPALRMVALGLIAAGFAFAFARSVTPIRPVHGVAVLLLLFVTVVAATACAALTMPPALRAPVLGAWPQVSPYWAVLIPAVVWLLIWALGQRSPACTAALGLSERSPLRATLVGVLVGGSLGLHFWITFSAVQGSAVPRGAADPYVTTGVIVWLACYSLGLQAITEEIFFRGAIYKLQEGAFGHGLRTTVQLVLLSVFVYLLPGLVVLDPSLWLWRLAYGAAFAGAALWLRYGQGGIAAPLAANVLFTVMLGLAGAL